MSSVVQSSPIAIIGGGLAGLTLSIALTRLGVKHKIYESAEHFSEIGAGIACGPNAVTALSLIDPRLRECYERCATYNESAEHRDTWLNYRWGMTEALGDLQFGDLITSFNAYGKTDKGRSCVHRAHFLEEAIQLVPPGIAEFSKTAIGLEHTPDHQGVTILFSDGTTVTASAVIACDGIKSMARPIMLENLCPDSVKPVFAREYAYRSIFPREIANEVLGSEIAGNGNVYCGNDAYVIVYPVDHGKLVNMVAIHRKDVDTWDHDDWLVPVDQAVKMSDFEGWGKPIREMMGKSNEASQWALFDAPDAPTYTDGLICLIGDAAHASTPNQGAGAAMAFEDAYILGNLLADCKDAATFTKAFKAYDTVRRPRTQRLVATSRTAGEVYELMHPSTGRDIAKIKENLESRHSWIWEVDLPAELRMAKMMANGSG